MRIATIALAACAILAGAAEANTPPTVDLTNPAIDGIPFPQVLNIDDQPFGCSVLLRSQPNLPCKRGRATLCIGHDDGWSAAAAFREVIARRAGFEPDGLAELAADMAVNESWHDWEFCRVPVGFVPRDGGIAWQGVDR